MARLPALLLATVLSYPLGLALGQPWLLPLLNAAPAYAAMAALLLRGDRRGAVLAMLAWAAALAVSATASFALWPSPVDRLVIHGPAYRDEMFAWIRTGQGTESSPRLFIPQHAEGGEGGDARDRPGLPAEEDDGPHRRSRPGQ